MPCAFHASTDLRGARSSTRDALRALYPLLAVGGIVYIDDYGSFAGCGIAVDEYRAANGIHEPMRAINEGNGHFEAVFWQKGRAVL